MRGSPPVQLALLLLGFFVVGVPLVQLTHGRSEAVVPKAVALKAGEARPVLVRIRYSQKPSKLEVRKGGENVLPQGGLAVSPVEIHAAFSRVREEGLEFSVVAEWPAGTPDTALTIEVEPDGFEERSQTFWSIDGRIEDAALFTWKP